MYKTVMPDPRGVTYRKKRHFKAERRYFHRGVRGDRAGQGLPIVAFGALALVALVVVSRR